MQTTSQRSSSETKPVVEMKGITKRFPGVLANDKVNFDLVDGEIHALLGENGAGKTTLMNILYGLYKPDRGEIFIDGKSVDIRSPRDAIKLGIGMVHQYFELIPTITVCENVILGLKSSREPLLELDKAVESIEALSKSYGLRVDPRAKVEQLSVGERQKVEIVKALYRRARILILDEPTSVLTPQETDGLFKLLRSMANEGRTIVFITHKLPEVMTISDRVTVLRHGAVVARVATKLTNIADLAEKMVGREVSLTGVPSGAGGEQVVLELRDVWALNDKGVPGLRGVSFSLHRGEILGIAGVAGNGQRELAEVITGLRKVMKGKVFVSGRETTNHSPRDMIELAVGYVPEDRLGSGIIMNFSVAENLILERRAAQPFSWSWFLPSRTKYFLNERAIRENAERIVKEYDIDTPSVDVPARNLSGGNLQRLLLAKILSRSPKLLVAAHPTAGLDVSAAQFIQNKLREESKNGVAILLISGDLNELLSLSHRIAVIYSGSITGIVPAAGAQISEIGLMMGGVVRS